MTRLSEETRSQGPRVRDSEATLYGDILPTYKEPASYSSLAFELKKHPPPEYTTSLVAGDRRLTAPFPPLPVPMPLHTSRSIIWSLAGLPPSLRYAFTQWNAMTHGNITFVVVLVSMRCARPFVPVACEPDRNTFPGRIAWFLGIGRTRYYYGQPPQKPKSS